jgi:Trk K+ transport system NAD-binding subunit
MSALPLIIVVGGDALAVRVCEELCGTQGHSVALLWEQEHELAARVERLGAAFTGVAPNDYDALRAAGVLHGASLMALSDDDRLNLQVALKARDLNPKIRIVLRQNNRQLGRKIEQNLPDCTVLSLSAHSAATYAAAAVDDRCFYALQFPDIDGPLTGFTKRSAKDLGVAARTVEEAEAHLHLRVVGVNGSPTFERERKLEEQDEIVAFGEAKYLDLARHDLRATAERMRVPPAVAFRAMLGRQIRRFRHADPIFKVILAVAIVMFVVSTFFFALSLHKDPLTSAYFVITTMTTVGYGDITPLDSGPAAKVFAMLIMVSGVAFSGIFIAFATSALTQAQFNATQGLRKIRARDHVIVCGAGAVGSTVIDYLAGLGKRVVVVDASPDPLLIESSRYKSFDVLTGDSTRDQTLDLCSVGQARSVVALTDSDTSNLEVVLGARARAPEIPVILRVQDAAFAESIARQFAITTTFSTTALAAPAFAGLSRFPGTRGRIAYGDDEYTVGERLQGEVPAPPPAQHCIPLCVWRRGAFLLITDFGQMEPFDRLLFLVPLSQFRQPPKPKPDETAKEVPVASGGS